MILCRSRWAAILAFTLAAAIAPIAAAAAQESEIRAVADAWPMALEDADLDGIMELFTADIVFSHPRLPAIVGKDALRTFVTQVLRQQSASGTSLQVEAIQTSGTWAHLAARFHTLWTPTDGSNPFPETARYLWILRRDATGAWRVRLFTFYPIS